MPRKPGMTYGKKKSGKAKKMSYGKGKKSSGKKKGMKYKKGMDY